MGDKYDHYDCNSIVNSFQKALNLLSFQMFT